MAAAFTASPVSGHAPLKVSFSNTSSGEYTDSLWDFGDGNSSQVDNPRHTYKEAGVYTVSLTISGLMGGDTETKKAYISVESPLRSAPGDHTVFLPTVRRNR